LLPMGPYGIIRTMKGTTAIAGPAARLRAAHDTWVKLP
jgi:hypothetical protein